MQSVNDETALLAAKRQFLPLQSRIEKQKNKMERVSKEIESKQKKRLEIMQKLIRNWKHPTPNRYKPNMRWRCWWLNRQHKMQKTVNQGNPVCQTHTSGSILIKLHNKPFTLCSNPFSRCKAWCATVFRNSSWRLARLRRMSRKSVRLWHRQCGNWKQGARLLNLVPRRIVSRAKWWPRTYSSPI